MLFFGLVFAGGWLAALAALAYAVATLVRIRPVDWVRRDGNPAVRLLVPTPAFLRLDVTLMVVAVLADLWFISLAVVFGSDGIFTEDWMGYPGMMDPTGRSYQADVVNALRTTAWWTFGTAVMCRCWITAAVQVAVLPSAAWWIGSFDTYYG
jgi:hypothetical protein